MFIEAIVLLLYLCLLYSRYIYDMMTKFLLYQLLPKAECGPWSSMYWFFLILRPIWNKINALSYIALSQISVELHCIALIFHKNINVKSMYISVKLPLLTIVYIYIALKLTLKSIHWTYFERKINALSCIDLLIYYIALPCLALISFGSLNTLPCFALIKKRPHCRTLSLTKLWEK